MTGLGATVRVGTTTPAGGVAGSPAAAGSRAAAALYGVHANTLAPMACIPRLPRKCTEELARGHTLNIDGFIRNKIKETLLLGIPQLMELTTSEILHIFLEHLQKPRLHNFSIPGSLSPIKLPSVVSLDIKAGHTWSTPRHGLYPGASTPGTPGPGSG